MNPENTLDTSNSPDQQTPTVVSNHEPAASPVELGQRTRSYSTMHLILVLFVTLIVAGGSIAGGASLINKSQKPFQSSSSNGSNPSNWVSYSSQDGHFSGLFPTNPDVVPQKAQAGQQGGTAIIKGVQSGNESTAYAVVYTTFSSDFLLSSDSNAILQGSVQGEEGQLQNGQIVSSNNTTVSGYPAETYEITGTKDGKNLDLTGELVLVNRVLYNAFTTQLNSQAANTQYFLNSFKVRQ